MCADGVGTVVDYMGMGWGSKRNHGNGVGMGLIFNTVSLFTTDIQDGPKRGTLWHKFGRVSYPIRCITVAILIYLRIIVIK